MGLSLTPFSVFDQNGCIFVIPETQDDLNVSGNAEDLLSNNLLE